MQSIEKKIKKALGAAGGAAVALAVIGIICFAAPGFVLNVIRYVLGVMLLALGAGLIALDIKRASVVTAFGGSVVGVISLILGIVVFANPGVLEIIPILLGLVMVFSSIFKFRLTMGLRNASTNMLIVSLISNLVTLVCGLVLVVNPGGASVAAIRILGIVFVIDGLTDLLDVFMMSNNVRDFERAFKGMSKRAAKAMDAVEAEIIVEDGGEKKSKKAAKKTAKSASKSEKAERSGETADKSA